jgi:hypothetical protein
VANTTYTRLPQLRNHDSHTKCQQLKTKNSIAQIHLTKLQIDGDTKRTWMFQVKALLTFIRKLVALRGVQIRSETDPIGFVRISEPKYSFRIGLIKLFHSRIGLRYPK